MSSFDLDKILAAIEGDMDQEARDRVVQTLTEAVEAAEAEAEKRTRKAGEAALERHREALAALGGTLDTKTAEVASATRSAAQASQNLRDAANRAASKAAERAVERLKSRLEGLGQNMGNLEQEMASTERSVESADAARQTLEVASTKATQASSELDKAQDKAKILMRKAQVLALIGACLAILGIVAAGWVGGIIGHRSAGEAYAGEFERLANVAQSHEARIAELVEQESRAEAEADAMAATRDRIRVEQDQVRQAQEELGIELIRRDDREIELRMGDAIITRELGRERTTVGLGDVRLRQRRHGPEILVILDNGLTLAKTSIGSAAHNQEIWWTRAPE